MKTRAATAPSPDRFTAASVKPGAAPTEAENVPSQSLYSLITQQPFFKGLNAQQLQLLTDSALEMQFEPGQWILQEGSPANRCYLL